MGSPPLARGILNLFFDVFLFPGITPACAGNTVQIKTFVKQAWDHPRLRGEYLFQRYNGLHSAGSPPLARGIQGKDVSGYQEYRITPACAGNTYHLLHRYIDCMGSPPLARGIPYPHANLHHVARITPACAGNTTLSNLDRSMSMGSPPLARGIH